MIMFYSMVRKRDTHGVTRETLHSTKVILRNHKYSQRIFTMLVEYFDIFSLLKYEEKLITTYDTEREWKEKDFSTLATQIELSSNRMRTKMREMKLIHHWLIGKRPNSTLKEKKSQNLRYGERMKMWRGEGEG